MIAEAEVKPVETKKTIADTTVTYVPLGSTKEVDLKFDFVRQYLTHPTKSGLLPTKEDIIRYMKLCERQALDPWVGDAFLTGYDTWDNNKGQNVATFSLITAIQALLKRAELSSAFDGIESGVIVLKRIDGVTTDEIVERRGTIVLPNEQLIGGWARCQRKDRQHHFYASVQFATYDTGYSRWKKDPAGMIVKCAKAACLREAFPTHLAGLYTEEEMDKVVDGSVAQPKVISDKADGTVLNIDAKAKTSSDLAEVLKAKNEGAQKAAQVQKPVVKEPEVKAKAMSPEFESLRAEIEGIDSLDIVDSIEADVRTFEMTAQERELLLKQLNSVRKNLS